MPASKIHAECTQGGKSRCLNIILWAKVSIYQGTIPILGIGSLSFNIMKNQVDFMKDMLYYKSPVEILAYCMTMTDMFVVDSSYPLYEYCCYLYK